MAQPKKAQVIITANASVAERVMQELEGAATRAANRMKSLATAGAQIKDRMRQLAAANKQNTDEYRQLNEQLKLNNKEFKAAEKEFQSFNSAIRENVKDTKRVEQVMKDLANTATRDLRRALQSAKRELEKMSEKDPRRMQVVNDMKQIQAQIDKNTGAIRRQQSAWGTLGTTMKNLFAYAGIFAGFNMLKSKFEEIIQKNREMSDQLANIRKVSGLAMSDINQLNRNLAKIDTRSSISELNELAYVGSKLGFGNYGIEGLESFVKSAVKVNNALKEDLGEDSMMAISKLVEVMGLIPKLGVEKAMDSAGSAIFRLASTSTATGANIIEFSKRLMGLANVSHITVDQLLALGSASDAMGLMPEVSATAFNKVFTSIQSNTKAIEQSLQMQKGELAELINEGKTMEAIVTVFDKMHGMNMDELKAKGVFKALGSDGARLNNVMITMSDRIDMLKTHLRTSNQAFSEGSAVAQEYAIQMETAEAYFQRAANLWTKAFVNPEGVDLTKEFAKAWYDLSVSLTQSEKSAVTIKLLLQGIFGIMKMIVELLPALISGFAAWGAAAGITAVVTKLKQVGGLITAIGTAIRGLSWAGWAGIVAGAAMGVYTLYTHFKSLNDELRINADYMKGFKRDLSDLNTEFGKSEAELRRYRKAIDEATVGSKQRAAAISTFNSKFGQYIKNMLTEKSTALDVANAYNEITKAMRAKLALQLKEKDINEQVLPREQWRASRRTEYDQLARQAGKGQYGGEWITGFAQDNQGKNLNQLVRTIAKQYYNLPDKIVEEVVKQAAAGNRKFNNYGNIINSRYLNQANALLAAGSFLRQDRSAETAMRRVNAKWKPEQDAMDAYIAAQNQQAPITPIDSDRPSKEELRQQKKEEAEYKQAIRKELQDAQRESDAIISKIEEWYRLQEAVITGFAADGKITQKQAEVMTDQLNMAKNIALADARRGISGRDETSWQRTKQQIGKLMFDTSDMSKHLLEDILNVRLENVRTALGNIDKAGIAGISSTAMRDKLNKNAAGNMREVERIQNKSAKEVEKMVKQYDYLQQAIDAFNDRLTSLGLLTESAASAARRIQQASSAPLKAGEVPVTGESVRQQRDAGMRGAVEAFLRQGAMPYTIDYNDPQALRSWFEKLTEANIQQGGNGFTATFASWAEPFQADFELWVKQYKDYIPQIRGFYLSLIDMANQYYDAKKKLYEQDRKRQEERFRASGEQDEFDREQERLETLKKIQDASGFGLNFWQKNGLASTLADDPEIERIKLRMEWRAKELQDAKERGLAQELINQRQTELLTEFTALAQKVSSEIASRVQAIQSLSQPVADFAEDAGQKLGDMMFGMESQSLTWNQIWKNMVLSLAQATVKMGAQWLTQKIQQALFYKQMEADEMLHQAVMTTIAIGGATARMEGEAAINATSLATNSAMNAAEVGQEVSLATILTSLGISKGASKIIGTLGWWGIPLIAVISSLLLGLLASALSTAGAESSSASSAAKPKVKLASGMLTYDEGNVSQVLGSDGRVYSARGQKSLPSGVSMVTEPIATTVNGQQALVGERGPELVIGRRTTRQLMLNRPDILQALSLVDRGITSRAVRTFDEGNLSSLVASLPAPAAGSADGNSERDAAMMQQMRQMSEVMQGVLYYLQNPVAPEIPMYGEGGLRQKMKQADKFMSRYEG